MDQWSGYQDMPHEQVNWAALAQQWMAMKEAEPEGSAEKGGHPYAQEGVDHSNWSDEAKKQPVFPSAESVSNERQYASGYHGEWASNDHPPPPQHMMSHGYSAYPPPPPPNVYNGYDNGGDVMGWNRPPGPPGPPGPHSSHGGGPWYPGPPPFYPPFDPTLMGMPPHAAARGSTPPFFPGNNLDANSRKKLPAWILEGLDKAEKEKQKQLEKQERIRRAEEERAKRRALAGKGKFDSSSEEEEENQADDERSRTRSAASWEDDGDPVFTAKRKEAAVLEDLRTDEEKKMDALQAVKLIMTSLLMECTDGTLHSLIEQCLIEGERKKAAPKLLSESSALAALSSLGGEDDDSGDEEGEAVQAEVSQSSSPEPDVAAFKAPLLISRNISKPEPTGNKDSTSTPSMSAKPVVEHANGDSASDEEEQSDIHSKKKKRKGDVDESERKRRRSRSRERHRSRSRDRKRSRSRDRKRSRSRDRKRSRSKERKRSRSKERRHRSRSRDKKRSRSRGRRSRSREKRRDSSRDRSRSRERRRR